MSSCPPLQPRAAPPQPAAPARPDPCELTRELDQRTVWPTHRIRGFLLSQQSGQAAR